MKRAIAVLLTLLATLNLSLAEETAFRGVKLADAKGKQADASLIFSDNNKNVLVRVADRDFVAIPYDQLDKFSYETASRNAFQQELPRLRQAHRFPRDLPAWLAATLH